MNLETLHKYYEGGWLIKQTHPTLPLTIWNYSQQTQYEGKWDEVTMICRGLITDNNTGKILVRPFPKFFNYEEVADKGVIPIKGDYVYVQEKMDGSLGILFNYQGEWIMATRGSFTSDQAIKGMEILKRKYPVFDKSWLQEYAYLVEIIYPENRIVVEYEKEQITFLSVVLNEGFKCWKPTDETEIHWTSACSIFAVNGIKESDIVKTEQRFNFSDELYKLLKEKNEVNKEGFVLRYFPGNFRMKIKFKEYIRLHKIMTEISTKSVWECLSQGDDIYKLLEDVPDEFFDKIDEYAEELISQYIKIEARALAHFASLQIYTEDRAEFAKYAKLSPLAPILFKMLDSKDYANTIWRMIKPEYKKL